MCVIVLLIWVLGKKITQASKFEHKSKLYSFRDRTVHVRGGIYRGPNLRILYTNDHFTPNSNHYNPFQLQGRSGLFLYLGLHSSTLFINLLNDFVFWTQLTLLRRLLSSIVKRSQTLAFAQSCFNLLFFTTKSNSCGRSQKLRLRSVPFPGGRLCYENCNFNSKV